MAGEADKRLISQTRETYSETYTAALVAQYKLYVDSAQGDSGPDCRPDAVSQNLEAENKQRTITDLDSTPAGC